MMNRFLKLPAWWQVAWLVTVTLGMVLVSVPCGEWLFGREAWWGLAWGWAGCVVPGCLVLLLAERWPAHWNSLGLLGVAMTLRTACAAVAIYHMDVQLRLDRGNTFTWITLFYLSLLAVESALLMHREDRENYQQRQRRKLARATPGGLVPGPPPSSGGC